LYKYSSQLVEIAPEEECAIKSERFRKQYPEKEQFMINGSKKVKSERAEVRVATMMLSVSRGKVSIKSMYESSFTSEVQEDWARTKKL